MVLKVQTVSLEDVDPSCYTVQPNTGDTLMTPTIELVTCRPNPGEILLATVKSQTPEGITL